MAQRRRPTYSPGVQGQSGSVRSHESGWINANSLTLDLLISFETFSYSPVLLANTALRDSLRLNR
jgi:hypothetical protein